MLPGRSVVEGRVMRRWFVTVAGLAVVAVVAACSAPGGRAAATPTPGGSALPSTVDAQATPRAATQSNEGGGVTVVVTWSGKSSGLTIDVALDTHSVDLDVLDLKDAVLRNDRGETVSAKGWDAAKGGHHRSGALTLAGDPDRFLDGARWIELSLPGIAGVSKRTFRWYLEETP